MSTITSVLNIIYWLGIGLGVFISDSGIKKKKKKFQFWLGIEAAIFLARFQNKEQPIKIISLFIT